MKLRGATLALWIALGHLGCSGARPGTSGDPSRSAEPSASAVEGAPGDAAPEDEGSAQASVAASSAPAPTECPKPSPARLPPGVLPGVAVDVPVPGDRSVRVVHGGANTNRALVYLHGMCGNPEAMNDWSPLASHYGTLVVLRADVPCGDRPGFKWPGDIGIIQQRIDRALDAVAAQRGGHLDREKLTLIGYSQGAHRGERLAEAYPDRYPLLILGGPPGTASPERLARTQAVAILGGELENTEHMQAGDEALRAAGLRSRFFLLPRVGHGGYGPEGVRVLGEVFAWLFDGVEADGGAAAGDAGRSAERPRERPLGD